MKRINAFEMMMKSANQRVKQLIPDNFQETTSTNTNITRKTSSESIEPKLNDNSGQYLLQFDGGSRGNPGVSGCGSVIYYRGNEIWNRSVYLGEDHTNNYAEYYGVIYGLIGAKQLQIKDLKVQGDSKIIINQLTGKFKVNSEKLKPLFNKAKKQFQHFNSIEFSHIYRNKNKRADELANIAMDSKTTQ